MTEDERKTAIKFGEALEECSFTKNYTLQQKIMELWIDFVSQFHGAVRTQLIYVENDARHSYRMLKLR